MQASARPRVRHGGLNYVGAGAAGSVSLHPQSPQVRVPGSGPTPVLAGARGSGRAVAGREATGRTTGFPRHGDAHGRATAGHGWVLSGASPWGRAEHWAVSTLPSAARRHTRPSDFSSSMAWLSASFPELPCPSRGFWPMARLASSFASCSANFLNMLA